MDIQELQLKVKDSNEKVAKRMILTSKAIAKTDLDFEEVISYFTNVITNSQGKICSDVSLQPVRQKFFPNEERFSLNEVMDNLYKLRDLLATNYNWKVRLDKAINEEKEEKIEIIWKFLQNWRQNARKFFMDKSDEYVQLKKQYNEKLTEYKNSEKYQKELADLNSRYRYSMEYRLEDKFYREYYSNIPDLSKSITRVNSRTDFRTNEVLEWVVSIDEKQLDKVLDNDVKAKYKDLVNRITFVVGKISDASQLKIGLKGDINGIIVGDKGKARIETIGAGGYNIQCYHYRTLIHQVK